MTDGILYLVKTGCQWRNMPSDFPHWRTIYGYFVAWRRTHVIRDIQRQLVMKVRQHEGKKRIPTIAILDSQSVKTGKMGGERGYDGGKRVKGRKRHIAVDSLGLVIGLSVTAANTHDQVGGRKVVQKIVNWLDDLSPTKVYADGGYGGKPFAEWVARKMYATVDVVKGVGQKVKGFVPIAKRWVVERTFAWFGDYRRLDKDQERLTRNSVAMIRWASINMMLRRLTKREDATAAVAA